MRLFLSIIILFTSIYTTQAQLFRPKSDTSALTWKIRFVPDIGLQVLSKTEHYFYDGEKMYSQNNETLWKWQTIDSTMKGGASLEKLNSFGLGVTLNLVDNLYIGFSYSPLWIRRYKIYYDDQGNSIGSYLQNIPLFSLGGTMMYDYTFPFYKRLSLQPSVSVGGYQSTIEYEGPGREFFYEGRMGLAFRPFKYDQIRLWCAYQQYAYRENSPSYIFDKNRTVKTDVLAFAWGLGYSFNLNIQEEIASKKRKEPRKAKKS